MEFKIRDDKLKEFEIFIFFNLLKASKAEVITTIVAGLALGVLAIFGLISFNLVTILLALVMLYFISKVCYDVYEAVKETKVVINDEKYELVSSILKDKKEVKLKDAVNRGIQDVDSSKVVKYYFSTLKYGDIEVDEDTFDLYEEEDILVLLSIKVSGGKDIIVMAPESLVEIIDN